MARVQGYSEDDVDLLIDDFTAVVEAAITHVARETANGLRGYLVAADSAGLGPTDVAAVTQLWQDQVDGVLTSYVAEVYTGSATQVAIGLADAFPDDALPGVPLVADEFTLTYLKTITNTQFGDIGADLWEDIRNELIDGVAQGQSIDQIADRIVHVAEFTKQKSTVIARTVVHGAAESGSITQMRFVGYEDDEVTKEWLATIGDGRTRPTHVAAHEQRVRLGQPFTVGGWPLDHPGDPTAPADEVIQCRCTMIFEVDEAPKFRCQGVLVSATAPQGASTCVIPAKKPDISHLQSFPPGKHLPLAGLIHNAFMQGGITPAYGGAKIHKVLALTRQLMKDDGAPIDSVSDWEILAAVDQYYVAKKDTFFDKYAAWFQSPAGQKVVGSATPPIKAVKAPIDLSPTPPAPTASTKLLSAPSQNYFKILDDPGPSGDGEAFPGGPWGKYGASGVLVRAVDGQGVARFLLIQRGEKYIGSQKFKWQLPGGGADKFEGPYEAAARELWEETAPTKEYVESLVPLGEFVFHGPGGWKYTNIVAHANHTFVPKVHGSTGDAKWFTLQELEKMLDDGDIVKELSPTLKQLATETDDLAKLTPQAVPMPPSTLPAVAAKPHPNDIVFTGQTLGSHGAQVWKNPATGDKWLFKPQDKFLTDLDVATARIQSKALQTRPGIYPMSLNGQHGSIQYMFENSTSAWPNGGFDPLKLTAADLAVMQREQVFDWMISNFDTHSGQWIRLQDGTLFETDKGQAFKFFGKDKLDWNYVPVYPLGQDKLTYSPLWKAFVQGKDVKLNDPTEGPLGDYVDSLMAIDDDTYRKLLEPYAFAVQKKFGTDAKKLLAAAVDRKNNLKNDFKEFWEKAVAERQKVAPAPKPATLTKSAVPQLTPEEKLAQAMLTGQVPAPTTPAKVGVSGGVGPTSGDISFVDYFTKQDILQDWIKLGGGKKVTPAWGGAKIYKMLQDLKKKVNQDYADAGITITLNDLQLLRVLDDVSYNTGKPKTYEGEVVKWLQTPGSTKTILQHGLLDPSLDPAQALKTAAQIKPVQSVTALVGDEATEVLATGTKTTPVGLFKFLDDWKPNDVIAYVKTKSGDILRARRADTFTLTIDVQIFKNGKWITDKIFTDSLTMMKEYDLVDDFWSMTKPSKIGVAKIPGASPGSVVSAQQIWDSRNLWVKGDVIAETTEPMGSQWRLVSDGLGNIKLEAKTSSAAPWVNVNVTITKFDQLNIGITSSWKATSFVVDTQKPAFILGKKMGDPVDTVDIFHTMPNDYDVAIAYSYETSTGTIYRVVHSSKDGKLTVQWQVNNQSWKYAGSYDTWNAFEAGSNSFNWKWVAAGQKGEMPPGLGTTIPGKSSTVPGKTATKIPGFNDGDEISTTVLGQHADQFADYEVIALGTDAYGTEYRLYSIGGIYVREYKQTGGGWTFNLVIHDISNPGFGNTQMKWFATTSKASPSSVGAKDAKKAVAATLKKAAPAKKVAKKAAPKAPPPPPPPPPKNGLASAWPHKSVGDVIGPYDIWDNYQHYDEGMIVAYGKNKWTGEIQFRAFIANGNLVTQKKTNAGAWASTKVVTHKYSLSVNSTKWEVTNDKLEPAKLKAAQKQAAKQYQGQVTPTPTPSKSSPSKIGPQPVATPSPAPPIQLRHVDLTPWDHAEREEIYQFFRKSGTYTSASPEAIWSKLQETKSHFQTKYKGKYLNLNEIEILRMVDEHRALTKGVVNTHPYEAKVINWLKTPAGKAYINKKIDAPIATNEVPMAMEDFAAGGPLDTQKYAAVSKAESLKNRQDSHAKYGGWKPGEKEALKSYTGGAYSSWNQAIRTGTLGGYKSKIIKAQEGMRPSVRPMLLHRKTSFAELNDPSISSYETLLPYVGRTYINRGFNSTSYSSGVWSGNLHIEIEAPIGTPMSHAQDYSNFPGENEVTLATHLIYQILSVKKDSSGKTVMRVRVIGQATV